MGRRRAAAQRPRRGLRGDADAKLPGLHHRDATLDAVDAAADATHPDAMTAILSGAGLVAVRERTYTGAFGRFARVVIRAWVFASADGAGSFTDWIG